MTDGQINKEKAMNESYNNKSKYIRLVKKTRKTI